MNEFFIRDHKLAFFTPIKIRKAMEIPQLDRSNYLKGLLITARKDKQLSEPEKLVIKKLSDKLGFSPDFYDEIINNLLHNKYITEDPIKFSTRQIAESFVEDGLKLALSDSVITDSEMLWLNEVAEINEISPDWFEMKLNEIKSKSHLIGKMDFALYAII